MVCNLNQGALEDFGRAGVMHTQISDCVRGRNESLVNFKDL